MLRVIFFTFILFIFGISTYAQQQSSKTPTSTSNNAQSTNDSSKPGFQTEKYKVTVDSINQKANNYIVTLVFENLIAKTITVRWLHRSIVTRDEGPHLVDEKSNKYTLVESSMYGGVLSDSFNGGLEVLPGTKLKITYTFNGDGGGKTFDLVATDSVDILRKTPIVIKGLKINANVETGLKTDDRPSLTTESYKAVVESAVRNSDTITITMIFESLLDKTITLEWGEGLYKNNVWESSEPYLIDDNADRYYLRKQDSAKIVSNSGWSRPPELLPGTKLKTQFVFSVAGNSNSFTFACKEKSPRQERPIVIPNIKVTN